MMLSQRISEKADVRVGVIGIGYVGLPLAIKLAEAGFSVVGIDINQSVIDNLNDGKSTVEGIPDERIANVVKTQKLQLVKVDKIPAQTADETIDSLMGLDVVIVCVPTPLHRERGWAPETILITKAAQLICRICEAEEKNGGLPDERLVVLESTTYPGTTRKIFSPIREKFSGQGKSCYLAYSPERTSPGPTSHNDDSEESTFHIKRIIAGIDPASAETAENLYQSIFREIYPVADLETAEMTKLVENTFRFVSIAFANEMGRIAKAFDLNIWEIIRAVKTKPFGLDICYPGLVGGHCLPIDPHYLGWAYRNHRNVATFVEVAEKSHQDARRDTLELIQRILSQHDKGLPKASILFFGVAYKKNVGDTRESGVLDLMKKLLSYGADISFWDPVRTEAHVKQKVQLSFSNVEYAQLPERVTNLLTNMQDKHVAVPRELTGSWSELKTSILSDAFDCVVLATDHDEFHQTYYQLISDVNAPSIIDINNTIESWLGKPGISKVESEEVRRRIQDRSRYMLFGRD